MKNKHFYTADIETKGGFSGKFLIGGLFDGKNYEEFQNEDKFMYRLINLKGTVFFHYSEFDFRFILNWVIKNKFQLGNFPILADKRMIILKIKDKNVLFRDSFFLLNSSIEKLAEDFKIKTKKVKLRSYYIEKITPKVKEHLKADTIILHQAISKFYNFLGWQFFNKRSIAAVSLAKFKGLYYHQYSKIIETPLYFNTYHFIKEAYFASYSHFFNNIIIKNKDKQFLKIDINSFYAGIMKDHQYPFGNYFKTLNSKTIEKNLKELLGIIKVKVKVPEGLSFGFLPKKVKNNNVEYPIKGNFEGFYTSSEILYAQELGYQFEFKEGIFWQEKDYIFKDFINYLYQIKKRNRGIRREIIKRLLVSFYGKFSQRRKLDILKYYKYPPALKVCINNKLGLYEDEQYRFFEYSHPEISIFTTSYARIFLYKLMLEIGFNNICAIITDSLIINANNLDGKFKKKWFSETELGKFKIVCKIDKGIIFKKGIYALKDKKGKEIIKNQGGEGIFNKDLKFKDFEKVVGKKKWEQYTKKDKIQRLHSINSFLKGKTQKLNQMKNLSREVKIGT